MTITSQIVVDAFRQSNLLALGVDPTPLQQAEALRYLGRIVKSVFGYEAGEPLYPVAVGYKNVERPIEWSDYYDFNGTDTWFPKNGRAMLNLEESKDIYLTPVPDDGTRFAVLDVSKNLSQFPVTVYGNGANIEGQPSIGLGTDGLDQEWFYRADLGNWVKTVPITEDDVFPFPEEFDDFFITTLAMRLNPSYGAALDPQSAAALQRAKSQFSARYNQDRPTPVELGLLRPAKSTADRQRWYNDYSFFDPNRMFNRGWPF